MPSVAKDHYDTAKTCTNLVFENVTSKFSKDSIEHLPPEILFLIIERVDAHSYVNCLYVSKQWRSITLSIANRDKTNLRWRSIFELYHEEETFKLKSNKLLSYKDLFRNLLLWNFEVSFSLKDTCLVDSIKKNNIYRDYIIVINYEGVKYFDLKTLEIKRELYIQQCFDFNERDAFVIRSTKVRSEAKFVNLLLCGKNNPDDYGFRFEVQVAMIELDGRINERNSIFIGGVSHYMLEKNSCYVSNNSNILTCYTWADDQTWNSRTLGRFYGNRDDLTYAMNVLHSEVFLLIKWGQLMYYCFEKRNFQEATRIRMPRVENVCLKIVHKYCVVIGVPHNCEFRITRLRNNGGYHFYKFECPNLTCVTEHGEMLFLGFRDGRIELYMPRAISREDIFKRRIHVSDFQKGHIASEDLTVVSIDVYEDFGGHHLFIATSSCVYHLMVTHPDGICVWENIPERVVYYKYPIRTRYLL